MGTYMLLPLNGVRRNFQVFGLMKDGRYDMRYLGRYRLL